MKLGPLGILSIFDHAVHLARRRPMLALGTVVPCSMPLAAAVILEAQLVAVFKPGFVVLVLGAAATAALFVLRSIGWGAAARGVLGLLEPVEKEPTGLLRRAFKQAADLFGAQGLPVTWALFGLLLTIAPIVLSIFASNMEGNPFASLFLAIVGSTVGVSIFLLLLAYVSKRSVALPAAAYESLPATSALKRSRQLMAGQSIRALMLQAFLLLVTVTLWLTLLYSMPVLLSIAKALTGMAMNELSAILTPSNTTYMIFMAGLAFVLMEPVRCFSMTLLYADCRIRHEGADLRALLHQWSARVQPTAAEARR